MRGNKAPKFFKTEGEWEDINSSMGIYMSGLWDLPLDEKFLLIQSFMGSGKKEKSHRQFPMRISDGGIVMIDTGIYKVIRKLNKKGYHTLYCCEGSYDAPGSTYISFTGKGWKNLRENNKPLLRWLSRNTQIRSQDATYFKHSDDGNHEEIKELKGDKYSIYFDKRNIPVLEKLI